MRNVGPPLLWGLHPWRPDQDTLDPEMADSHREERRWSARHHQRMSVLRSSMHSPPEPALIAWGTCFGQQQTGTNATVLKVDGIGAYDHVLRSAMLVRLGRMPGEREDTQKERQKERKWNGRGKKKRKMLGPPHFGAAPSGPHPSGSHPSLPPPCVARRGVCGRPAKLKMSGVTP